jgi:hypothetical protein
VCPQQVTVRWLGFYRVWQGSGEVFDTVDLFLPDVQFETQVRSDTHARAHRQTDRQTDRRTGRQTDRQTDRQSIDGVVIPFATAGRLHPVAAHRASAAAGSGSVFP